MNSNGSIFLEHSLKILVNQTFKDFEIVVSDHSSNDEIQKTCENFQDVLNIKYLKNIVNVGSSSANINNCILNSSGKLIKILFQDDFLYDNNSLFNTINNFDLKKDKWLVSRSEHSNDGFTFYRDFKPYYNENIHLGINTISSPSVLTILNENPFLFDENLICLMDCDYYKRCFEKFGEPKILDVITVVNRTGNHQVSNTIVNSNLMSKELDYVKTKFK
jgi:glycosyltransferase involved in cell wall biosynthesis